MKKRGTQSHINQDVKEDIVKLYDHARVANDEMGQVKEHLSSLQTDMEWVKKTLDKLGDKIWWILGTIIVGTLIQIIFTIKH